MLGHMSISKEVFRLPGIVNKFTKAGLTLEISRDLMLGKNDRNIITDAEKLLPKFLKEVSINFEGEENLQASGLIAFNHPSSNVVLPAFLSLIVKVKELTGKDVSLLMASEITLTSNLNDKIPIPGSIFFMKRFHNLYGNKIISSPTVTFRKDYLSGRAVATRKVIKHLHNNEIVAIAPEGHVEINNEISPPESFHEGSGFLARMATKNGQPIIPIGIWKENDVVNLKIGKSVNILSEDNVQATKDLMKYIAENLPEKYRGPFKN